MLGKRETRGGMQRVITNLIDRFNEKVIEEIPLLVGNALWRYRERLMPSDGWNHSGSDVR